jgi:hypothetical protein
MPGGAGMKWLKNRIRRWLTSNDYDRDIPNYTNNKVPVLARKDSSISVDGLNFSVMAANGGVILQTRSYDHKTDRSTFNTYLITDEEPLAERVGQIVALEILKS